jgi:hypothetical protein
LRHENQLKEQILHLDPHDDFVSARDKMGWVQTQRVLLVWPERGPRVLARRLDLLLLQRHAHRLGARLALITRDPVVDEEGRALGLPIFSSLGRSRRSSWRSRLPAVPTRLRSRPDFAKVKPVAPPRKPATWQRVAGRVVKGLAFAAGVAALAALAWALVPSATVTLAPATRTIQTRVDLVADPQAGTTAASGAPAQSSAASAAGPALIGARTVHAEVEDTGRIATTGHIAVPSSPAAGTVVFTNLVGARTVIPQGTGVRTTSGASIRFVTNSPATLDGRLGATIEVGISAEKPGPDGNVAPGQINAIDGPLGLQLAVTNPAATQGGALTQRSAVAAIDRINLRAQLLDQLQAKALGAIQTQLQPTEFLVTPSITVTSVVAEVYNLAVGDQADTLELTLRLAAQGLSVNEGDARAAAERALEAQVPPGERLLAGQTSFDRLPEETLDAEGKVHFAVQAAGHAVAHLDSDSIRQAVRGKTIGDSLLYLAATQPLEDTPRIDLWPAWLAQWYPHLPWVALRIKVTQPAG